MKKLLYSLFIFTFLFFTMPVYSAQETIVIGDTFGEAWGKQNSNNTELYGFETSEQTWRSSVTQTEMGYLHGVTSGIQAQLAAITPNATHTSEVTGATALTIANNIIEEVNLECTNAATDNYILSFDVGSGGFTWIADSGGGGDLLADGSIPLTANWDVGAYTITGTQFISDIAIGTSPLVVTSTTVVTNLNADLLDGESAAAFEDADAAIVKSDENETITGDWSFTNGITSGASALPTITLEDSDLLGADEEAAKIFANATTVTDGSEVTDLTFTYMDAGTVTDAIIIDGSDNQVEFQVNTTFQAGDIVLAEMAAESIDSDQYVDASIEGIHLEATNAPTDDYALTYDTTTGGFTWVELTGGAETNSLETVCTGIATTEIAIGTAGDTVAYATLSGDITMTNNGDVTIAANAVEASMIADLYAYQEIPIAWMNGGTSEPDDLDSSTRTPYAYRTFAHDADEDLNFVWVVPADLSGSTIQYRVYYLITNATGPGAAEGVAFGLSGVSLGNNNATNGAKGSVVVITDDALNAVQHDVMITGWSGDVTITNLAAGEVAEVALIRDVSDAIDDYAQVVGVFMVQIRYVMNPVR